RCSLTASSTICTCSSTRWHMAAVSGCSPTPARPPSSRSLGRRPTATESCISATRSPLPDMSDAGDPAHQPPATSGYVPVNGLDMYYEIHGDGSPLALLHGAMGTIDSCFPKLLPALAATRQVIAVELQGHGHTADVDRPLSYRQLAADTVALLEALGIGLTDLVGYSLGGAVAMQLAMQHPGMARRVVFAG